MEPDDAPPESIPPQVGASGPPSVEARYRSILDVLAEGILVQDAAGTILECNASAAAMLGVQAAQLVGAPLGAPSWPAVREDGSPFPADEYPAWIALRTGAPVSDVVLGLRRRDGALVWLAISARAIWRADGTRPEAVVTSLRDVTAGKLADAARASEHAAHLAAAQAAERRSAFIAEASDVLGASLDYEATLRSVVALAVRRIADLVGVYVVEPDGAIRQVAAAHVDPSKEPLLWELHALLQVRLDKSGTLTDALRAGTPILVPDIPTAMRAAWSPTSRADAIVQSLGLRSYMVAPFVLRGRVLGAIALSSAESGRRFGAADLALAHELGRRAGAALDAARLYREAREANRLKDEFLANVSHELRTPLTAILGWTRMLRTGSLGDDKRARALETIQRNANAQVRLVEDLLDVSRIISGKLRLDVATVDPARVVAAALEAIAPAAAAKNITLDSELDADAGVVSGDADRLQQVAWNLLSNAVKFTPAGGRVRALLRRDDAHVVLIVSDDGQGIAPAFLPHVFERFRQADASLTRTQGGLGLGLAITHHLVELHGGTIVARSDGDGRGASFTVRLPLARQTPTHAGRGSTRPPGELAGSPSLAGVRVLVVDDEPDARELVASILEHRGADVTVAGSAAEALEAFAAGAFDVIVSDIGMPERTGYDLIQAVRAFGDSTRRRTPAIALTARASSEDRTRALVAGFDTHISKPVEPMELLVVVANLVGRVSAT